MNLNIRANAWDVSSSGTPQPPDRVWPTSDVSINLSCTKTSIEAAVANLYVKEGTDVPQVWDPFANMGGRVKRWSKNKSCQILQRSTSVAPKPPQKLLLLQNLKDVAKMRKGKNLAKF